MIDRPSEVWLSSRPTRRRGLPGFRGAGFGARGCVGGVVAGEAENGGEELRTFKGGFEVEIGERTGAGDWIGGGGEEVHASFFHSIRSIAAKSRLAAIINCSRLPLLWLIM